MAQTTRTRRTAQSGAAKDAAAEAAEAAAPEAQQASGSEPPIVYRKKKKKKKRKYTKGTKDLQRYGEGLTKGGFRVANAVADGMDRFYKRSRKSSRRRRDGAARDIWKNAAKGFDDGFRELGKAPYDVARKLPGNAIWKASRPAVTFFTAPFVGFFR